MKEHEYALIKRLRRSYIVALSGIALLATASCAILVHEIYRQENSSRVINISGRQRMLSQNIVKNLLLLDGYHIQSLQARSRAELSENYKSWIKAQQALLHGDASLDIPSLELSDANAAHFKEINPYYNGIVQVCKDVLDNNKNLQETDIKKLLYYEQQFLKLMDKITFQFDKEAKAEVGNLKRNEIIFWLITLITLLTEAVFIFKPIIKLVHKNITDYNILFEEKQKQELESLDAIVEAQEKERTRIANDLHDGIAPTLSLVKVNLSAMTGNSTEQDNKLINATQHLIDKIITDLKGVSYNLMPSTLSHFGLIPALNELRERMQYTPGISFTLAQKMERESFGQKIDINIYRIVQELINNTIKHTKATKILLQLIEHEDMVTIVFENNGIGFDPVSGQRKHESRGLKNIMSRIRTLDGGIQFDTGKSGEIMITLEIPIHN